MDLPKWATETYWSPLELTGTSKIATGTHQGGYWNSLEPIGPPQMRHWNPLELPKWAPGTHWNSPERTGTPDGTLNPLELTGPLQSVSWSYPNGPLEPTGTY